MLHMYLGKFVTNNSGPTLCRTCEFVRSMSPISGSRVMHDSFRNLENTALLVDAGWGWGWRWGVLQHRIWLGCALSRRKCSYQAPQLSMFPLLLSLKKEEARSTFMSYIHKCLSELVVKLSWKRCHPTPDPSWWFFVFIQQTFQTVPEVII